MNDAAANPGDAAARVDMRDPGWRDDPHPLLRELREREDEFVISTDEKTSIQARLRIHPSVPTGPGETMRVEHEYTRGGAWATAGAELSRNGRATSFCHLDFGREFQP